MYQTNKVMTRGIQTSNSAQPTKSCYHKTMKLPWKNKEEPAKPRPMTDAEYLKLGKAVEQVYVSGYASKKQLFKMSLYKGIGYGLGIFIGGTIIVALLAYTISQFETVPFLKDVLEPFQQTIQQVNGGPIAPQ